MSFVIARDVNNKTKQDLRQGEYAVEDEDVLVESLDINIDDVKGELLMEVRTESTQQSIRELDWNQYLTSLGTVGQLGYR